MLPQLVMHFALVLSAPLGAIPAPVQEDSIAPGMEWTEPSFAVGAIIEDEVSVHSAFPGLDLPILTDGEGYVRGNENIYRVDTTTMEVLEIVPIGTVILY